MPWPSFSIVIPTYQRRDLVCEAVRALARLEYSGAREVIVVVDGSTDGTAAALAAIVCPFPLRVVEQSNGGAGRARNAGAGEAGHDIILFLDDDMFAEPNLLDEHARLHRAGADAVIGKVTIDPASPPGFLPESVARWISPPRSSAALSPFDIFSGQLSVRRAIFEELGGFDPALTSGSAFGNEDADFGVKLLARYDVRYNPAAVTRQHYVVSPRQYMQRAVPAARADLDFMAKHPELVSEFLELKGLSRPLTRFVYRPLSRIPILPQLVAATAVKLAEIALATPLRSNRALARLFSGARSLRYWSALRANGWRATAGPMTVLCYHAVGDHCDDPVLAPWSVTREMFVAQLDDLSRRGFSFISPDQFAGFLVAGVPLPPRPALLTFDDGYAELLQLAREVLAPRGIKGLVSVVSGLSANEWDQASGAKPLKMLDDEQLREIESLGLEIGAHSRTHRFLPSLGDEDLKAETQGARDEIAARGHRRPRFFVYPWGGRNAACIDAVKAAGFVAAFGTRPGKVSSRSPLLDLPRVEINAADRGWRFRMKTTAPAAYARWRRARDAAARRLARLSGAVSRGP